MNLHATLKSESARGSAAVGTKVAADLAEERRLLLPAATRENEAHTLLDHRRSKINLKTEDELLEWFALLLKSLAKKKKTQVRARASILGSLFYDGEVMGNPNHRAREEFRRRGGIGKRGLLCQWRKSGQNSKNRS